MKVPELRELAKDLDLDLNSRAVKATLVEEISQALAAKDSASKKPVSEKAKQVGKAKQAGKSKKAEKEEPAKAKQTKKPETAKKAAPAKKTKQTAKAEPKATKADATPAASEDVTKAELKALKVGELRDKAKDLGADKISGLRKQDLIDLIIKLAGTTAAPASATADKPASKMSIERNVGHGGLLGLMPNRRRCPHPSETPRRPSQVSIFEHRRRTRAWLDRLRSHRRRRHGRPDLPVRRELA